MLIDQGRKGAKVWLIGTAFELDSSRACLDQKVSHQLMGHVSFLALLSNGWRGRGHLHGQPVSPSEGVAVSDDEGPWFLILQECNGLLSGDLRLVPILGSVLDKLHFSPCLRAIIWHRVLGKVWERVREGDGAAPTGAGHAVGDR